MILDTSVSDDDTRQFMMILGTSVSDDTRYVSL
jgi:hypothetical protein